MPEDSYLWNRKGPRDPFVVELERTLAGFDVPTALPAAPPRRLPWMLAAAVLVTAGLAAWNLAVDERDANADAPRRPVADVTHVAPQRARDEDRPTLAERPTPAAPATEPEPTSTTLPALATQ